MAKKLVSIIVMLVLAVGIVLVAKEYKKDNTLPTTNTEEGNGENKEEGEILIWYAYDYYEEYIAEIVKNYSSLTGKKVTAECVGSLEILEKVNAANMEGKRIPDLYIIGSENLEKAYLMGLAKENVNTDIYNSNKFFKTALDSATYNGKLYAYPLGFESAAYVYNKDFISEIPTSYKGLMDFADKFDSTASEATAKLESIFMWNANAIMYNYGFIGEYINFEGKYADKNARAIIDREKLIAALKTYKSIYEFFSIGNAEGDYEKVVDNFAQGKIMFTILNVESLRELDEKGVNYGVAPFPTMEEGLENAPLMLNDIILVNPYSEATKDAEAFAMYLTNNATYKIYEKIGILPAKKLTGYKNEELAKITSTYDHSSRLPNMVATTDYWLKVENLFKAINKEGNIEELVDAFIKDINAVLEESNK